MKTHLAVTQRLATGQTLATTLCGRKNKACKDGRNATLARDSVTCDYCLDILSQQKHWRLRAYGVRAD